MQLEIMGHDVVFKQYYLATQIDEIECIELIVDGADCTNSTADGFDKKAIREAVGADDVDEFMDELYFYIN